MNPAIRKARKKPVEIEFMAWPGGAANATPVIDWILSHGGTATWDEPHARPYNGAAPMSPTVVPEHIAIRTLEGTMMALPGDVIIRGIQGEFYPCKPDIFRDTYDIITDQKES